MIRQKRVLLVSATVLVTLVFLFVIVFIAAFLGALGPPLSVAHESKAVVVHVETLSEYPTTIRRVRIEEVDSRKVVFEAVVKPEFKNQTLLRHFSLVRGRNSVYLWPSASDNYTILVPEGSRSFSLQPGIAYRVEAWNASPIGSRDRFTF